MMTIAGLRKRRERGANCEEERERGGGELKAQVETREGGKEREIIKASSSSSFSPRASSTSIFLLASPFGGVATAAAWENLGASLVARFPLHFASFPYDFFKAYYF